MPYDQCPLTDEERSKEVLRVLDVHLAESLDKYFKDSPFVIALEQHYNDHQLIEAIGENVEEYRANHAFVSAFRDDVKAVKRTFLQRMVTIFTVFLLGGLSFSMWVKYFKD